MPLSGTQQQARECWLEDSDVVAVCVQLDPNQLVNDLRLSSGLKGVDHAQQPTEVDVFSTPWQEASDGQSSAAKLRWCAYPCKKGELTRRGHTDQTTQYQKFIQHAYLVDVLLHSIPLRTDACLLIGSLVRL